MVLLRHVVCSLLVDVLDWICLGLGDFAYCRGCLCSMCILLSRDSACVGLGCSLFCFVLGCFCGLVVDFVFDTDS